MRLSSGRRSRSWCRIAARPAGREAFVSRRPCRHASLLADGGLGHAEATADDLAARRDPAGRWRRGAAAAGRKACAGSCSCSSALIQASARVSPAEQESFEVGVGAVARQARRSALAVACVGIAQRVGARRGRAGLRSAAGQRRAPPRTPAARNNTPVRSRPPRRQRAAGAERHAARERKGRIRARSSVRDGQRSVLRQPGGGQQRPGQLGLEDLDRRVLELRLLRVRAEGRVGERVDARQPACRCWTSRSGIPRPSASR